VAWNMAEKQAFASLVRASWGDAAVLLATFFLTIFADLTLAIAVGVTLGAFLFLHRMAESVEIAGGGRLIATDTADTTGANREAYDPTAVDQQIVVYRITGAFFFGATASISSVLDRIGQSPRVFVLDLTEVPLIDSTGANALESFALKLHRAGTHVYLAGASKPVRRTLLRAGLRKPHVRYVATVEDALARRRQKGTP
ncbi:MAG: SulP family inorganic anion transporter, partial [Hyphomicrobiaceae bacterium]|nr:SulP family inorganic anion transporter [Hyphomicrobiaceae bacterium]